MEKENGGEETRALSNNAQGSIFVIRVKGHLDDSWSDWLEGLKVRLLENGEMVLSGPIRDQSALLGILNKLHGLNLALLAVSQVRQ